MELPEKVRNLLKMRGMSQTDLAASLATSQQQVSRWLDPEKPPRWSYLLDMARTLGVTVDYLLDPEQKDPAPPSELTDDERAIIELCRDLELSRREAVRRLANPLPRPRPSATETTLPNPPRFTQDQPPRKLPRRKTGR